MEKGIQMVTRKQINKIMDKEIKFLQKQAKIAASGRGKLDEKIDMQWFYLGDIHTLVQLYTTLKRLPIKQEAYGFDLISDNDTNLKEMINDDVYEYFLEKFDEENEDEENEDEEEDE